MIHKSDLYIYTQTKIKYVPSTKGEKILLVQKLNEEFCFTFARKLFFFGWSDNDERTKKVKKVSIPWQFW